jgi:hypothetical protein
VWVYTTDAERILLLLSTAPRDRCLTALPGVSE